MVVALLVGGFAGCSTLQSIAVCSNAAGEYENENENEFEYMSRRGVHPFSFKWQAEEVCAK